MSELDNHFKEKFVKDGYSLNNISLTNVPPADLHKFADELEFLELCDHGHEERLERSFTNENGE